MISKRNMRIIFIIFLLLLIRVIVFKYPLAHMQQIASTWRRDIFWEGLSGANFELFKTIKMYVRHWDRKGLNSFGNLIGNFVAFIPLGYMLPRVFKVCKNVFVCMLMTFSLVMAIELFQLFSAFGVFDVDDILLNCLGSLVGYISYQILKQFKPSKSQIK